MNMIRHDHERMQLVPVKPTLSITYGLNHEGRNFRNAQVPRPGFRAIQDTVHRDERLAAGQAVWREHSIGGQAVVKTKSDEKRPAHHVPVRQPSLIVLHLDGCGASAGKFSGMAA